MLEKIGLPARPSLRGNNWVVDASHCQGCSSQFTFINRKHHCRRCGGIFCNSCTQQRMVLRGQGDSPVRICEPCKKLEEAARFEMRHGYKSRIGRGGSKVGTKYEDEVLNKINIDGKQPSLSGRASATPSEVSDLDRGISIASSSSLHEEAANHDGKDDEPQNDTLNDIGSNSPEELRQQAVEEKKKYRILKGENKPEEALKAFKRGKELERQAKALEIALRKSHRKALSSNSLTSIQQTNDDLVESGIKRKSSTQMQKENKDDLVDELRELGWSDADLHDADKKTEKISLEGEFSSLLRESHGKSTVDKGAGGIDKTQVIALKKKALALKREGKIAEAKEELKQAKILEKQLEEQEFLGGEDSDDEISALIRSMDDDKEEEILLYHEKNAGFNYDNLLSGGTDLGDDGFFDVTDEDMNDPEMTTALKSLGWTEDLDQHEVKAPPSVLVDANALHNEILSLKKEAVNQKRAGNTSEALTLLRKAKLLEKDIEKFESQGSSSSAPKSMTPVGSTSQFAKKSSMPMKMDQGMFESVEDINPKLPPKSKLMIQRELLGIKKKALALRREGRLDEADEELKKGKVLEYQLEEMENAMKSDARTVSVDNDSKSVKKQLINYETSELHLEIDGDVTERDMHDPALLSQLEQLGWNDESIAHESLPFEPPKQIDYKSEHVTDSEMHPTSKVQVMAPRKSRAEIQRELLQLKRKALALRRQGKAEEAEDVLEMAKALEAQMEAIEAPNGDSVMSSGTAKEPVSLESHITQKMLATADSMREIHSGKPPRSPVKEEDEAEVIERDMCDPMLLSQLNDMGWKDEIVEPASTIKRHELSVNSSMQASSEGLVVAARSKAEVQRELLGLKRKALNLRRQGETDEAEKVLKLAKELELQLEEMSAPRKDMLVDSTRNNNPEAIGAIISQKKPGNMKEVEVFKLTTDLNDASTELFGLELNKSMASKPHPLSSVDIVHNISKSIEDKSPLIDMPESLVDKTVDKDVCSFPQSGQSVQFMDLLSGGNWQNSESSVEDKGHEDSFSSGIISKDNSYVQPQVLTNPKTGTGSKSNVMHEKEVETVGTVQKSQVRDTNSALISNVQSNATSLQQEILSRKRKAVSLKREGKLVEAREELRQAKLLEKNLQDDSPQQPDAASTDVQISTNHTSPHEDDHRKASQVMKPTTGRDRFKLQQESLAHKRQALKLRREGRIGEAEAEFELAKSLESQLEELSSHDSSKVSGKAVNETEAMDDLGVEDLLDPQLLYALKAIGLQDVEIAPQVSSARPESAKPKIGKPETSMQEKNQLEELIKAEKLKAVNLKRAGKQSEALDALRRSKMYEKKLNSLFP